MKILKITSILLLLIIIFCILFIRVVPDYSNKYGFEIVSINDYKKYKQGYCLKEDRILSKDEIYKRAIMDYFNKDEIIKIRIQKGYCERVDSIYGFCDDKNIEKIGFYKIEGFTKDNIVDIFKQQYEKFIHQKNSFNNNYFYFFSEAFNTKKLEINKLELDIDLQKNTAGPNIYMLLFDGSSYYIYINKIESFYFYENGDFINISANPLIGPIYGINDSNGDTFSSKFEKYFKEFKNKKYFNKLYEYDYTVDNCGFTNIDINKRVKIGINASLKGG